MNGCDKSKDCLDLSTLAPKQSFLQYKIILSVDFHMKQI